MRPEKTMKERTMKIIAVGAVTAGGKTTAVNAVRERLPRAASLHFDDYSFEGEVEDFSKWISEGADVHVWDLSPLKEDIERLISSGEYDYLLLDYPFAYEHRMIKDYLDCCIFIDTPLDIALARRIMRDMKEASADDIREEIDTYLKYARILYVKMQEEQVSSVDHVINGSKSLDEIINEITEIVLSC